MKKGKLIVIEGIDGTGKETQTTLLVERLKKEGHKISMEDYPRYETSFWGKQVGRMLTGEFGELFSISPYLAALPYMLDEAEGSKNSIEPALNKGNLVISNRYFTSNIHQIAKEKEENKEEYAQWLWNAGYKELGITKPDLVIVLIVDEKICRENILMKAKRSYANGEKLDQAEQSIYHQMETAKEYRKMVNKEPKIWKLIDCTKDGKLLSREIINKKIYELLVKEDII